MNARLLFRDRGLDLDPKLPSGGAELVQDLGLEAILHAMASGDEEVRSLSRAVLLADPIEGADIAHRQAILSDCLRNGRLVNRLYSLVGEALEDERRSIFRYAHPSAESLLGSAIGSIEILVEYLVELRDLLVDNSGLFSSAGLSSLVGTLASELNDEFVRYVRDRLRELRFDDGLLSSAELDEGCKGRGYLPRRPIRSNPLRRLSSGNDRLRIQIAEDDEAGARELDELRDRALCGLAGSVARARDHILGFLASLRAELAFYVGCVNLHERLSDIGMDVCMPVPAPAEERERTCRGLYDASLALVLGGRVVRNDLDADGMSLVLVTGANQGGKSTFLRSVGQAQLMMQCGMFVPAHSFRASSCVSLFTHFRRGEDASMKSGKLDEELARMSGIVDRLREGSILLLNESFAATNEREGSEIASVIVRALVDRRVRVFYVTHLYEFANGMYESRRGDSLFLRAQRREDGSRTYRLEPGEPLETSFGKDLYEEVFR